jgi:hypothetical protein
MHAGEKALRGAPPQPPSATRWAARRITAGSCVAQITVCPSSEAAAAMRLAMIAACVSSNLEVGSSTISSPRALATARASATRCASPAERRWTRWPARSARPTRARATAARSAAAAGPQPRTPKMSTTFSMTLRKPTGSSSCGRYPMRSRRSVASCSSSRSLSACSSIVSWPESGRWSPAMSLSSVVLPVPEGPSPRSYSRARRPA